VFDEFGYPRDPYDEVVAGLFQASSRLDPSELLCTFDAVFDLCGSDRTNDVGEDPRYVFHQIDDVPSLDDPDAIHQMAVDAAAMIRVDNTVVVNCAAGLNRSGLLVGRTLIELGYPPLEAVELVRAARGTHALSNPRFERFLLIECTPRALARQAQGVLDLGGR
jgi:hypothetical protein